MIHSESARYNTAWGASAMAPPERARNLSVGEYYRRQYARASKSLAFGASSPEEMAEWRAAFGEKLRECLGPFPESCYLDPEVIETVDAGSYRRERVLFNSEPDMAVVAYVLVPKGIEQGERRPGVLACHGHGNGKDDVVGIDHGEKNRRDRIRDLNYDYAHELACRGYVVIAPDWRSFGERRLGGDFGARDACNVFFIKGMLLGLNLLALNIWDAMCSIDYLQLRTEVDPNRIGCVGLSYGGTMTLYTAALDERVKCTVVSGYLNSFESYAIGLGNTCGAQTPAGLLSYGEMSDIGCMIAPRPLLIESGTGDDGFPIDASREAAGAVSRAYGVAGVPDRFDVDEFDGGHQWSGVKAYDWLDKWLGAGP